MYNKACDMYRKRNYRLLRNKSDNYLYLYIINLQNSLLKPFFWYTKPNEFVWADREF